MSVDLESFRNTFLEEAQAHVDIMEAELLELLFEPASPDRLDALFRGAHSIKGGAGMFGFTATAGLCHVLETVLDAVRSGELVVGRPLVDALLAGVDSVKQLLAEPSVDGTEHLEDEGRVSLTIAMLQAFLADESPGPMPASATRPPVADVRGEEPRPDDSPGAMPGRYLVTIRPESQRLSHGQDPLRILFELDRLGEMTAVADESALPDLEGFEADRLYLSWAIALDTPAGLDAVRRASGWVPDSHAIVVDQVGSDSAAPEAVMAQPAPASSAQPAAGEGESPSPSSATDAASGSTAGTFRESASIRVGIDKIDALMNLVGELVITQSMLGQMGDELETCGQERLLNGIAQLERHTRELQENVMKIRMVPISNVFNRLPRLVHDLSARLGKMLDLEVSGEETEVDKTVLERIGDPLVHLVRNAIDHGIECPEDRLNAGKPRRGRLALRAFHANGNIVVEVADDGAGLNAERILGRARQKGLVGDDSKLSDQQLKELIFHPGFSTAEDVTDVSGRGVGMDVVKNNVESLGGMVDLASRPGVGSTFTIRLPLTLAIIDGQLIRVGQRVFVVPLVSILESLQVDPANIKSVGQRTSVYHLRGDYVPVVALTELFGVSPRDDRGLEPLLMVLEAGGEKIGLLVDDLLTQQQVVIKSMESNFRRIEGVAGATILGDGTVSMILDIPGLLSLARARRRRAADPSLDHQAA